MLELRNVTAAIALFFYKDYTENSSESTLKNTEMEQKAWIIRTKEFLIS